MSVAADQLSQHIRQVNKKGQWVAVRRFTGTTTVKTYIDTPVRGYVLRKPAREFVGAVVQNYLVVVVLADTLGEILPLNTNDKLMIDFYGHDTIGATPGLDEESHVSGGKQFAISSVMPRTPGGLLIAIELHAVG